MGFDIYGLDPVIHDGVVKPEMSDEEFKEIAESEDPVKKKRVEEYFNEMEKYESANIGFYFRNNVWWWRPIAMIIEESCKDLLTKKQVEGLHMNDGVKYPKELALEIARRLDEMVEAGMTNQYVKPAQHELNTTADTFRNRKGVEGLLSNLGIKSIEDESEKYPFDMNNMKNFIAFAKESGGFQIW